jgi:hypothetical protein
MTDVTKRGIKIILVMVRVLGRLRVPKEFSSYGILNGMGLNVSRKPIFL